MLNGSVNGFDPATGADFDGAAVWINDYVVDDGVWSVSNYSVRAWNNPSDRGGVCNDTDRFLCVRSTSIGPRGTKSSVEVILVSQAFGEAITGYFAQAGGGAGKNYNSRDASAISNFTVQ